MSQVSIVDIVKNNPQIPTLFIGDIGEAIPIANTLEILGDVVPNQTFTQAVYTIGSGNTITTNVQLSAAITAPEIARVGLAAFDEDFFDVDENGFVTFTGSSDITINGDVGTFSANTFDFLARLNGFNLPIGQTAEFKVTNNNVELTFLRDGVNMLLNNVNTPYNATGGFNVGLGPSNLQVLTTGAGNTCVGNNVGSSITTGSQNTLVGSGIAGDLTSGIANTLIGAGTGFNYTVGTESNNILLGYLNGGVAGENDTTRIGVFQTRCFIDGIANVTIGSNKQYVVMESTTDQLGTQVGVPVGDIVASTGVAAPAAGVIGQQIRGYFTGVGVGSGVISNIGTIVLTPGVWDVSCNLGCAYSTGSATYLIGAISTAAASIGTANDNRGTFTAGAGTIFAEINVTIPSYRIVTASNLTVYLCAQTNFPSGTGICTGRLSATRVG